MAWQRRSRTLLAGLLFFMTMKGVLVRADVYDVLEQAQALAENGRLQESLPLFTQALSQASELPQSQRAQLMYNVAFAHQQVGQVRHALQLFQRAAASGTVPDAFVKAAQCAQILGEAGLAAGLLEAANGAYEGGNPEVLAHLGDALNNLKRWGEAESAYKSGLSALKAATGGRLVDGRSRAMAARLYTALGDTAVNRLQPAKALVQYKAALRIQTVDDARVGAWRARADLCDWSGWEEEREGLVRTLVQQVGGVARREEGAAPPPPPCMSPYDALFLDLDHATRAGLSSDLARAAAAAGSDAPVQAAKNTSIPPQVDGRLLHRPLRVGYVSRRFHDYPGTWLLLGTLARHHRARVHVYCYATGPNDEGGIARSAAVASCDMFRDVANASAAGVASAIAADGVDVVLDYDGAHSFSNIAALRHRPASAVQLAFLGFAGPVARVSTRDGIAEGNEAHDGSVVDAVLLPPEAAPFAFPERLTVFVPGSYQPQDPVQAASVLDAAGRPGSPAWVLRKQLETALHHLRLPVQPSLPVDSPHHHMTLDGLDTGLAEDRVPDISVSDKIGNGIPDGARAGETPGLAQSSSAVTGRVGGSPIVLASFNRWSKITPADWAVWTGILRRVPRAVLWLYGGGNSSHKWPPLLGAPPHVTALWREAAGAGVHPGRVVFAGREQRHTHLARHIAADMLLDCGIYGAHTTASDGLATGLPLLTMPGPGFASRVGASLVQAASRAVTEARTGGINNSALHHVFIVHSSQQYEDVGTWLSLRPRILRYARDRLADAIGHVARGALADPTPPLIPPSASRVPALYDGNAWAVGMDRAVRAAADLVSAHWHAFQARGRLLVAP